MSLYLPTASRIIAATSTLLLLWSAAGCRREPTPSPPVKSLPPATTLTSADYRPEYAKYLQGLKICLDPGHGGRAEEPNFKRGPTGLREAEVNLRVALLLRDMLEAAGVQVIMTRREDIALHPDNMEDLRLRAEIANQNDCDLFLSIHHNGADNPAANYTSVWYHGNPDDSPAGLDFARAMAIALVDGLQLPQVLPCPILSDLQVSKNTGFRVLRLTRMPAVLTEASFHSNPQEEARLRDPQYNLREASALFLGLARYAYGGLPRALLIQPADGTVPATGPAEVVLDLHDGLRGRPGISANYRRILQDSITLRVGGERWPFEYDENTSRLSFYLPTRREPGTLPLDIRFETVFKHANTRPRVNLRVGPHTPTSGSVRANHG